jgi:hypothetical protein
MTLTTKKPLAVFAATLIATCCSSAAFAQIQARTFDSPEQAASALIGAASKDGTRELTAILGSAAQGILTSGNAAQDTEERQEFSKLATTKNQVEHSSMDSTTAVLLVGAEGWPFPIPLARTGQKWSFDAARGAVELRARKIGGNELDAIEMCAAYVGAQEEYAAQKSSPAGVHAYAQSLMSLNQRKAASGDLIPEDGKPYHGYYFRVIKEQGPNAPGGAHKYVAGGAMIGGFALVAWPAEYGATGIHTFIVNHDGEIYEKDFGPRTVTLTPSIARYDPDSSWTAVE